MIHRVIKRNFTTAYPKLRGVIDGIIKEIRAAGTYKEERVISSSQDVSIHANGQEVLNFCANNYLGLSNNPEVVQAAIKSLETHGFGMSSVRFICGTQDLHKKLEHKISEFHGTEDTILFPSCFDANGGFFEAILTPEDAVISDSLNHASIIDGIRLCKAQRLRYAHNDLKDLEQKLAEDAKKARTKFIVTDGVFSMDGDIAPLPEIVELARKYDANIFIDECHGTGVLGKTGRGTPELFGVQDEIDVINSTLGKALGGGTGGYTTGRKQIIQLLRQKARPYLFSNSIAPPVVGASLKVFEILSRSNALFEKLQKNTKQFREGMGKAGFEILGNSQCPIVPVLLKDARLATEMADEMMKEGIYVIGFSFPVVPHGQARIRVQISAAHSEEQISRAVNAFTTIGRAKGVIN